MKDKIEFQLEEFELGGIDVCELIKRIKEILKEFNKRENVDSNDQINCYCGHTTMCDCQPLNAIEKAENDFIKSKIEEGEESGFVDSLENKLKKEENDR